MDPLSGITASLGSVYLELQDFENPIITNNYFKRQMKSTCTLKLTTMGPAYNEFGYKEHPAVMSRFLCIKIIDCNVKKSSYNKHPLLTSSFFCIISLVVSGTQCI